MPSRRDFLRTAGATTLAACAPTEGLLTGEEEPSITPTVPGGTTTPAETSTLPNQPVEPGPEPDTPWAPPGAVDPVAFAWGVQTGDALADSALVSVRTTEPEITLVLARGTVEGWEEAARLEGLLPEDGVVQARLGSLTPDTTWSVVAYARAGDRRSSVARFRTGIPAGGARRVVRFGATSCLGGNRPWPSLRHAAGARLDFFVLLGDTIYADNNGWGGLDPERSWSEALQVAGLQELTGSTSVVATWDDHEVDNNWSWHDAGMPGVALSALQAFRRALPQRVGPGGSGIWRRLSWGDVLDLFVLDCRGERLDGDYISPQQLEWLKAGLSASTARFKIIANSVPICDMSRAYLGISADGRWDGYPHQRDDILDHIEREGIAGVLWISGDFHFGALATVGRPGQRGDGLWEVFCGPGGSLVNPIAYVLRPDNHFHAIVTRFNVVVFEADADAGVVRVAFIGDDGAVITSRTLTL